jgi:hypothetical protein
MAKGPGTPAIELALKLMARKRMKDDEAKKVSNKNDVMSAQDMLDETSPVYGRSAMSQKLTGVGQNTSNTSSPYNEASSKEELIKEGFFVEKDGDLIPTQKYFDWKKSGKLKGKYNIS